MIHWHDTNNNRNYSNMTYFMPGTRLSAESSYKTCKVNTIIIFILQMMIQIIREFKWLVQGYKLLNWQDHNSNPGHDF